MRIRIHLHSPISSQDGQKYLLLIDRSFSMIQQVQRHIISTLNLDAFSVQLMEDDCIIPSGESTEILEENRTYQCKVFCAQVGNRNSQHKQASKLVVQKKKGLSSQRKKQVQSSSQSSSEEVSSESESEEEKYLIERLKKQKKKEEDLKKTQKPKPQPLKVLKSQQVIKKTTIQRDDEDTPEAKKPQKQPIVKKIQKKPEVIAPTKQQPHQERKPIIAAPQIVVKPPQKVVQYSDDSEQQPKPQKVQIKTLPKQNIPIAVRKQQFRAAHKQEAPTNSIIRISKPLSQQQNQPQLLSRTEVQHISSPPTTSKYQIQQTQWKQIPVKILEKCRKTHNRSFLIEDMSIMFQTMDLDEEKFIPKVSDWKKAQVKSVKQQNQELLLVVQPRRDQMKLCEYNLLGLKVQKDTLTDFQQQVIKQLEDSQKPTPKKIVQEKQAESEPNKLQKPDQKVQKPHPQQSPYRDIVTSQVDFYFSDKNYNKDNYLISHAALHPLLYVNASVILNCPKIKRLNITEQQLMKYLAEDTRTTKTYELHPTEAKIRKKGLRIQQPNP